MGKSFGPNPQKFLLGGVPNWVLARTKEHSGGDPLTIANEIDNSNLLFTEFVNHMRGYDLNEKYGNAALLVNMELKFPVFQYLSRFPVKSTFLRNFMLVAFTDIGSAWDGKPPITRKNSIIFIDYDETPFKANVANYASPWLASYGFGLRTALLGYYLKLDYARPLEDFEIKSAKFTLSLGLDF
jgi:outer membrane protein assembly factor BamA